MKIKLVNTKIMKIMKFIESHQRIIPLENDENHEIFRISFEHYDNHENQIIQYENHANHEIHKISCENEANKEKYSIDKRINNIIKLLKFYVRIMKTKH